jgi:hypothetical protein
MSCGCDSGYGGYGNGYGICAPDIPYPIVSHESVPSLLDNLVTALYGAFYDPTTGQGYITKSISPTGTIVWNIPCDPSNTATIAGVARNQGEGLLCYLLRVFTQYNPAQTNQANYSTNLSGGVQGSIPYQNASNTTYFLAPASSAGQVLASGGPGSAPYWTSNSVAAPSATNLAGGAIGSLPYQSNAGLTAFLSAGTSGYVLTQGSGAPVWTNPATLTVSSAATATTATSATSATSATKATNLAGATANTIPYQSASATTSYLPTGTSNQVLVSGGPSAAPSWVNQSAIAAGSATTATSATSATTATTATNLAGNGTDYTLPYQHPAGTTTYLSPGAAGTVLTSGGASSVPYWSTPTTSTTTATNLAAGAAGEIPYQSGPGTTAFTTVGTVGQSLISNGSSAPTWGTPSSSTTATNLANGSAGTIPYQTGSGATSMLAAGTSGYILQSNGTSAPSWVPAPVTFKNRIINGGMDIDQRNGGWENGTYVASVVGDVFPIDRFFIRSNATAGTLHAIQFLGGNSWNSTGTGSISTPIGTPPSTSYFLGLHVSNAITPSSTQGYALIHAIEGNLTTDIVASQSSTLPLVLSFYVYSSITGTFSGCVNNLSPNYYLGNPNRSFGFNYTISTANTWQKISISIPADASGSVYNSLTSSDGVSYFTVAFDLGSGTSFSSGTVSTWVNNSGTTTLYRSNSSGLTSLVSNAGANFYISQVQLELGTVASAFEVLPRPLLVQTCQRYFETSYFTGPGNSGGKVGGASALTQELLYLTGPSGFTLGSFPVHFAVHKSYYPDTATVYSSNSGLSGYVYNYLTSSDATASILNSSPKGFIVSWSQTAQSGLKAGFNWTASAELNTSV